MHNPVMIGQRVYLRPAEVEDAGQFAAFYHDEDDDAIVEGGRYPLSPLRSAKQFRELYTSQPPEVIQLQVVLIQDDSLLGGVGLYGVDWVNRTAETASFLRKEYRNRGFGTEAKRLLLEYAFDHLQLHTLWATVWEANERSATALRKQGYRQAGRLKWTAVRRGVYRDTLLFDLHRDDWIAAHRARPERRE